MFLGTFEAAAKSFKGVVFVKKSCVPRLLQLSLLGTVPLDQVQRFFDVLSSCSNAAWIDALVDAVESTGLQPSSSPTLCAMVSMLFSPSAERAWLIDSEDSAAVRFQRLGKVVLLI